MVFIRKGGGWPGHTEHIFVSYNTSCTYTLSYPLDLFCEFVAAGFCGHGSGQRWIGVDVVPKDTQTASLARAIRLYQYSSMVVDTWYLADQ